MTDKYTSNGSTTCYGYVPEVRTSYHIPTTVGGQIVDNIWRRIAHVDGQGFGVPNGYFDKRLAERNLLGHAQAETIRWWFIAQAEAERLLGGSCLQTRLVEVRLHESYTLKTSKVTQAIDYRGNEITEAEQ